MKKQYFCFGSKTELNRKWIGSAIQIKYFA